MICEFCQNEMDTAIDCVGNHTALFPDGERLPTIPYAHPTDEDARCGDCGVAVGGSHHLGCGVERCPRCGGQRIGCDCGSMEEDNEIETVLPQQGDARQAV